MEADDGQSVQANSFLARFAFNDNLNVAKCGEITSYDALAEIVWHKVTGLSFVYMVQLVSRVLQPVLNMLSLSQGTLGQEPSR